LLYLRRGIPLFANLRLIIANIAQQAMGWGVSQFLLWMVALVRLDSGGWLVLPMVSTTVQVR